MIVGHNNKQWAASLGKENTSLRIDTEGKLLYFALVQKYGLVLHIYLAKSDPDNIFMFIPILKKKIIMFREWPGIDQGGVLK